MKENAIHAVYKAVSEAFYTLHIVRMQPIPNWSEKNLLNHARHSYQSKLPPWWHESPKQNLRRRKVVIPKPDVELIETKPTFICKAKSAFAIELWEGLKIPKYIEELIRDTYGTESNSEPHPLP